MQALVKTVGQADVQVALERIVTEAGGYAAAARRLKVAASLICSVANGHKLPTPTLLKKLRFKRTVTRVYEYTR